MLLHRWYMEGNTTGRSTRPTQTSCWYLLLSCRARDEPTSDLRQQYAVDLQSQGLGFSEIHNPKTRPEEKCARSYTCYHAEGNSRCCLARFWGKRTEGEELYGKNWSLSSWNQPLPS
jgi:hypothetical protein